MLSIFLTFAIPSMTSFLMNNKIRAATDLWINSLNYARNTALTLSVPVVVCPFSAAGSMNCGSSWSSGWIVYTQPSSGTGTLLQTQQTVINTPVLSGSPVKLTFDTHGLTSTGGNYTICDKRGASFALSAQVLATGFIQSGPTPGTAVWDNSNLACP